MKRLEEAYGNQVAYRWVDANSQGEPASFHYFQLVGHSIYFKPNNEVLLKGLSEQSGEDLEKQIQISLIEFQ